MGGDLELFTKYATKIKVGPKTPDWELSWMFYPVGVDHGLKNQHASSTDRGIIIVSYNF